MQRLLLVIAAAFLAPSAFAQPPQVKWDRFKQRTEVSVESSSSHLIAPDYYYENLWLVAIVKNNELLSLGFTFLTVARDWRYLQCHDITVLVDDKPYPIQSTYDDRLEDGTTSERVFVPLTRSQLAQWAAAKKIEYRICRDEKTFSDEFMRDIRDFGPVLDEQTAGPVDAPRKPTKPL